MSDVGARRLFEHWRWRPDWTPERACLWWYVTFEDQPRLTTLARRLAPSLRRSPVLDVIPPPWLHLTVREVGYADELDPGAVDQAVAQARAALAGFPCFDLAVGPIGCLPGAVVLEASPAEQVDALRARLPRRTSPRPGSPVAPEPERMSPHLSLAYVNRDCDRDEVRGVLPTAPRTTATVGRVTLAAVTRRDHHYQWTVRDEIPLAGALPAAPPAQDAADSPR